MAAKTRTGRGRDLERVRRAGEEFTGVLASSRGVQANSAWRFVRTGAFASVFAHATEAETDGGVARDFFHGISGVPPQ